MKDIFRRPLTVHIQLLNKPHRDYYREPISPKESSFTDSHVCEREADIMCSAGHDCGLGSQYL